MSERIRMLFVIGSMGAGGAEQQVLSILRHLDRTRFDPLLYLIYAEGELLDQIPEDVRMLSFWSRHALPRYNWPGRIAAMQSADLASVLQAERVQIMYARTADLARIAHGAVRRRAIPWVAVEVTDPRSGFDESTRFRRLRRWATTRAYRAATRIFAVSHGVRDGVIEVHGIREDKVVAVPNFVDLDRLATLASAPLTLEPKRFHVVAAGRLHWLKGYPYLIDAIDQLVHQRGHGELLLRILGHGPEQDALRAHIARRRLTDHVLLEGYVANPLPYLRNSNLFCLPSLYEGMPNALLEAMACGAPILSTDCRSGPRELLADGTHGQLVPTADATALADAIEDCIHHEDVWKERAQGARKFVQHEYSADRGVARFERAIEQVLRA